MLKTSEKTYNKKLINRLYQIKLTKKNEIEIIFKEGEDYKKKGIILILDSNKYFVQAKDLLNYSLVIIKNTKKD